jgi:1,2-dihydroxy-3-keto-5-methylthiopentene dioxygenase
MACMIFSDDSRTGDLGKIRDRLKRIGITLRDWPVPDRPDIRALLNEAAPDAPAQQTVLDSIADRLEALKRDHGYTTCDMIVMHENIPGLADMLAKFEKIHYHTDDEVRYILAGRGYFGFVDKDGDQFMLEVAVGDYINIPAGTEHWFTLGDSPRIKAVRYFIDKSGWTPIYTERPVAFAGDFLAPRQMRGNVA